MFPFFQSKVLPALSRVLEKDHHLSGADYFPAANLRWAELLAQPRGFKSSIIRSKILEKQLIFHLCLTWTTHEITLTIGLKIILLMST